MKIIQSTYPKGADFPSSRIYVCDLHFKSNEIVSHGDRNTLTLGSLPSLNLPNINALDTYRNAEILNIPGEKNASEITVINPVFG